MIIIISQKLPTTLLKINHYVMTTVFFLPLVCIAIYEVTFTTTSNNWVKTWFESPYDADDENPSNKDPEVHGEDAENGLGISRVKFDDLIKAFPNTEHVGCYVQVVLGRS